MCAQHKSRQKAQAKLEQVQTETERSYSERKVLTLDHQIDELVYELYDLPPEKIDLIEAGFGESTPRKPLASPSLF